MRDEVPDEVLIILLLQKPPTEYLSCLSEMRCNPRTGEVFLGQNVKYLRCLRSWPKMVCHCDKLIANLRLKLLRTKFLKENVVA